jgi:hypothetical protein
MQIETKTSIDSWYSLPQFLLFLQIVNNIASQIHSFADKYLIKLNNYPVIHEELLKLCSLYIPGETIADRYFFYQAKTQCQIFTMQWISIFILNYDPIARFLLFCRRPVFIDFLYFAMSSTNHWCHRF